MELPLDYATLKVLWWGLVGVLLIGYALTDGYDLGVASLLPFVAKTDKERRLVINSIGPMWEGHQVWLITGGGALFAAWPYVYAISFSGFYLAMFVVLAALILRPVGFKYRSKRPSPVWRTSWDWALFVGGFVPALIFGVALGNVLQGIAMDADHVYRGSWLAFLNPYALLTGLTTQALFMVHGAIYLGMKTEGRLFARLFLLLKQAMLVFVLLFVGLTAYTLLSLPHLTDRFLQEPWLAALPFLAFLSIANVPRLINRKRFKLAFGFSSIAVALLLMVVAVELYPVLLISTLDPAWSLTVYNAASSEKALRIMLGFAAVGTPLVLGYTFFVYRTFYGKVRLDEHSY